jgi:hypothetical protein
MNILDYDAEERKELAKNVRQARAEILRPNIPEHLVTKLTNYGVKHNLEYEYVLYKARIDDVFLLNFVKDPAKQTFHQRSAAEFIKKINGVKDFVSLPSKGPGSKFVHGGIVVEYEQIKDSSLHTKSIDFEWQYKKANGLIVTCYATHKHTKEAGGSQDNQFKDVQSFLGNAVSHHGQNYFFAICDGAYYQMAYQQYANKIDFLNQTYSGNRCIALTVNDLEFQLRKI